MTELRPYVLDADYDIVDFVAPGTTTDLTNCDREPIHLSEAIQPYGVLFAVTEEDLIVRRVSANTEAHLGLAPAELLSQSLTVALGYEAVQYLRGALANPAASGADPLVCHLPNSSTYELTWHRIDGFVVVEIAPVEGLGATPTSMLHVDVREGIDNLIATEGVEALCDVAAAAFKNLIGYDRVMVYRFHPDEHGEVVGERCNPDQEPFLGLNYPATDIPRQARKLFMLNQLRVIADVGYEPAPLLGAPGWSDQPLNLSLSALRSVSPVHIAYLTNMGVRSTLTISLVRGDRLWGMMACHHEVPKRIDARMRGACRLLGQVFSLQLVAHENQERHVYRARLAETEVQLVARMSGAESLAGALVDTNPSPLALTSADGMVARLNGRTVAVGSVPPMYAVEALLTRLRADAARSGLICNDLTGRFDELRPFANHASGVIALPLSAAYQDFVIWFRGEMVHERRWAGNPEQSKIVGPVPPPGQPQMAQLSPRTSFETWVQEVREHSRPWLAAEIEAARSLAASIPKLLLARAEHDRLTAQIETDRMEGQLHQSQRLESLGQLAGGVAHDFNNLLGVILNYSAFVDEELVKAAGGDMSPDWTAVQRDVAQVRLAADRAVVLTHQLLAFARREVVRPQVLALNEIVVELEQLLRRTIGEHVEMVTALSQSLWPVMADRGQIEQILVNLAVNARDAMPGGGTLTIQTDNVTVDEAYESASPGAQLGRHARIRVSDTGTGMPPEVIARVFEPFFTTKAKGEGSGLGLATVYGIVTQSGGHARIYSEPGMGTTISVLFPATNQVAAATGRTKYRPNRRGGETVLVVEDEEAMREVTGRILSRNGYHVLTAANGPAALELIESYPHTIDLLVTDVVMPHMLGKQLAERVIGRRPDIRVLYMSGYAQLTLGASGTLDPGVTLVEKPFSEAVLLTKVAEVFDGPAPEEGTVDKAT